ncbi:MAG: hypothetical protein MUF84_20075 [Anaerolineae bacterium]|nr:hypothetical protein [Anaerolineae bacterium]
MRKLKWLNILLLMGILLSACATSVPATEEVAPVVEEEEEEAPVVEEEEEEAPVEVPSKFQESPMLAAKVAAGELPPVDERLPTPATSNRALSSPGKSMTRRLSTSGTCARA